jgi:hypothetical protein
MNDHWYNNAAIEVSIHGLARAILHGVGDAPSMTFEMADE